MKNATTVLLIIFITTTLALGGYVLYDKVIREDTPEEDKSKQNDDLEMDEITKKAYEAEMTGYADSIKLARVRYMLDNDSSDEPTFKDISNDVTDYKFVCPNGITITAGKVTMKNCSKEASSDWLCSYENGISTCTKK